MDILQAIFGNGQAQQQPQNLAQTILASRFQQQPQTSAQPQQMVTPDLLNAISQGMQPSMQDIGNAAINRFATKNPGLQAQSQFGSQLEALKTISEANKNNAMANLNYSGGAGGQTMKLVQAVLNQNPGMSMADALALVKSSGTTPLTIDQGGNVVNLPGSVAATQNMAAGKETGQKGVELQYAAPIETAKQQGKGEISQTQQLAKGQNQLSSVVGDIKSYYNDLNNLGAAVSTDNSTATNAMNYVRNSSAGQLLGRMGGTTEQSIRNQINQAIPNLINAIRQSTGMSAKAMDSNAELKFYLQQATDPTVDIQANLTALNRIQQLYGTPNAAPTNAQTNVNAGSGGRVNIITPDGNAGTIDAAHLNDLLQAGGRLAQ